MRLYRALSPAAQFALKAAALVVLAISITAFAIDHARLRMERHAQEQRVCAADLARLRSTSAWAQKAFCSADPCLCTQILAGGNR